MKSGINNVKNKLKKNSKLSWEDYDIPSKDSFIGNNTQPAEQQNSKPSKQPKKKKYTFYLDESAKYQLNQLYIQEIEKHDKADKSKLICKAIGLLYHHQGS